MFGGSTDSLRHQNIGTHRGVVSLFGLYVFYYHKGPFFRFLGTFFYASFAI